GCRHVGVTAQGRRQLVDLLQPLPLAGRAVGPGDRERVEVSRVVDREGCDKVDHWVLLSLGAGSCPPRLLDTSIRTRGAGVYLYTCGAYHPGVSTARSRPERTLVEVLHQRHVRPIVDFDAPGVAIL